MSIEAIKARITRNYHRALLAAWGIAKTTRRVAITVERYSTAVILFVEERREADKNG